LKNPRAALSSDEAVSWRGFKNIEDDPARNFAYTSITFHGGRALLTYSVTTFASRDLTPRYADLRFRNVSLSWFYR